MATIDLGSAQDRLSVLIQSKAQLTQLFMVQCYTLGIDPLTTDIETYDFVGMHQDNSYVAEQLTKFASSLRLVEQQIADAQSELLASQGQ